VDTSIELEFADGRYRFWLSMAQITAVEGGDKSIMEIWDAFRDALGVQGDAPIFIGGGPARFADIVKVIRFGLIGGGECVVDGETRKVSSIDATRIVETFVYNRPYTETLPVAWAILQAAIFGVKLSDKKKDEPPKVKPPRSGKAKSSRTAANSA
jgi:hypothetical protein